MAVKRRLKIGKEAQRTLWCRPAGTSRNGRHGCDGPDRLVGVYELGGIAMMAFVVIG